MIEKTNLPESFSLESILAERCMPKKDPDEETDVERFYEDLKTF